MKQSTKTRGNKTKVNVRDLKPIRNVKGGSKLTDACATGKHYDKVQP